MLCNVTLPTGWLTFDVSFLFPCLLKQCGTEPCKGDAAWAYVINATCFAISAMFCALSILYIRCLRSHDDVVSMYDHWMRGVTGPLTPTSTYHITRKWSSDEPPPPPSLSIPAQLAGRSYSESNHGSGLLSSQQRMEAGSYDDLPSFGHGFGSGTGAHRGRNATANASDLHSGRVGGILDKGGIGNHDSQRRNLTSDSQESISTSNSIDYGWTHASIVPGRTSRNNDFDSSVEHTSS